MTYCDKILDPNQRDLSILTNQPFQLTSQMYPNVPNPERLIGDYKLREDRVTSLAGSITVVVPKTWWGVEEESNTVTISNTVPTVPSHESWVNYGEAPRKRHFGSQKVAFRYEFLTKHGHFRVPC